MRTRVRVAAIVGVWLLQVVMGYRVVVIGGGAAGYFAAIHCAETRAAEVVLLEASSKPLSKVLISGGGRCNVMHNPTKPLAHICAGYPRGGKELMGAFQSQFGPADCWSWFRSRGIDLYTQPDNRVFPTANRADVIVDLLQRSASSAGVKVVTGHRVMSINHDPTQSPAFCVHSSGGVVHECDRLIIACGSSLHGMDMIRALGHCIVPSVPSLFAFQIKDSALNALAGVTCPHVSVSLKLSKESLARCQAQLLTTHSSQRPRDLATQLTQRGPLLITQQGLSGPAVLRLSAFGARALAAQSYQGDLTVNWLGEVSEAQALQCLQEQQCAHQARSVGRARAFLGPLPSSPADVEAEAQRDADAPDACIPRRLWDYLLHRSEIPVESAWGETSQQALRRLAAMLARSPLIMTGRALYRDEFVTCGGVALSEVDMRCMQSKKIPGLFFAGEVLDVDGVTGGFNFQAAWTTGFIAGRASGNSCRQKAGC